MRRRVPVEDLAEPPAMPKFGPMPTCRNISHPGPRPTPPCGRCDEVVAFCDAVDDYHEKLSDWMERTTDRTPLARLGLVSELRRTAPGHPICHADFP